MPKMLLFEEDTLLDVATFELNMLWDFAKLTLFRLACVEPALVVILLTRFIAFSCMLLPLRCFECYELASLERE
jgi:hypothetical protein